MVCGQPARVIQLSKHAPGLLTAPRASTIMAGMTALARPFAPWRPEPGSYLLLLRLDAPAEIQIGKLGRHTFPPGRYAYAGSALGSGGVAGRVNRHLRPDKRLHWHIDHLAEHAPIVGVGAAYGSDRRECRWIKDLGALRGATIPVAGFGSSDCRSGCPAHLVRLPDDLTFSWIENELIRCPIQTI